MQKFKDFFYDDLSVTRGNYFLTLMAAFFITIILFIGIVVSEVHLLYSMLIVLVGLILLRLFKINLFSFKKLTLSQVIYIIGGALLIYGLDNLYLYFHDVPANELQLEQEIRNTPFLYFYFHCYHHPRYCGRNCFSRYDNKGYIQKTLIFRVTCV